MVPTEQLRRAPHGAAVAGSLSRASFVCALASGTRSLSSDRSLGACSRSALAPWARTPRADSPSRERSQSGGARSLSGARSLGGAFPERCVLCELR